MWVYLTIIENDLNNFARCLYMFVFVRSVSYARHEHKTKSTVVVHESHFKLRPIYTQAAAKPLNINK